MNGAGLGPLTGHFTVRAQKECCSEGWSCKCKGELERRGLLCLPGLPRPPSMGHQASPTALMGKQEGLSADLKEETVPQSNPPDWSGGETKLSQAQGFSVSAPRTPWDRQFCCRVLLYVVGHLFTPLAASFPSCEEQRCFPALTSKRCLHRLSKAPQG